MNAEHPSKQSTPRLVFKALVRAGAILALSLLGVAVLGVIIFTAGLAAHFLG